ncbi:Flp family type IVb pilin [Variovorax sp. R-27]|jgi:pilus assembly protein Flp/PilA|uniref:Flp family type IVb pilin n=1 Tax=Variovorax sp. R-27 TaxID=3404058 RepID=UPI003CE803C9
MFKKFLKDESGAQVVEYALIIAVVSIALVVALQLLASGAPFTNFISRVSVCLNGPGPCV